LKAVKRNIPIGWPEERQYYTESITRESLNSIALLPSISLEGKVSLLNIVTYEIVNPKPPHPIDVAAKFLDYSTYNLAN